MAIRIPHIFATALLFTAPAWMSTPALAGQNYTGGGSGGNVIVVQSARVGSNVSLGGTVVPYREVTLSAQIPGLIEYLAGEEGDRFDESALLVKVNDDELQAKRAAAEAELQAAYSQMKNADIQYSRELWAPNSVNKAPGGMGLPSLFDQFITKPMANFAGQNKPFLERQADLASFGSQVESARSSILRAQSSLRAIDAKLRDSRSLAPFNGVIAKKMVEIGDSVQPGQPLYKFADLQYLQIRIDVPARLMPGLRKGMIVPAKLDVGDRQVQVRVAQIFPIADSQRHTVTVKFDLPTGAPAAPGMYANVMIPDANAPARDTVVIPNSAVLWRGSLPAVEVLNEQNEPELRLVRVGEQVDRTHITILSGLQPGERIMDHPEQSSASTYTNPNWTGSAAAQPTAPVNHSVPSYSQSIGQPNGAPSYGSQPQTTLPPYANTPLPSGSSYSPGSSYGQDSYHQQGGLYDSGTYGGQNHGSGYDPAPEYYISR